MPSKSAPRDTSLRTYRTRRDFGRTPEPAASPGGGVSASAIFVVQKHAARRLHWDFRLEQGGVLWSWAVPKGPSLDPHDKRLAVRVEDHPLDYARFHGTIPAGNYGAGTVEIWDTGQWQPLGDPVADLQRGELKFHLAGKRLQGGFVLVRLKPRAGERTENWLLIKEHDAHERNGADAEALEFASTPRPMAQQTTKASPPKRTTRPVDAPAPNATVPNIPISNIQAPNAPVPGAERAELPRGQSPQLASAVEAPPEGTRWISEVKFDGYRLLAIKDGRDVRLMTRNGHDWTRKLPELARAVARLPPSTLILDGELVVLQPDGLSSFARLQAALSGEGGRRDLFFCLFDLPFLDGWDLRPCRLADRKAALRSLCDWQGVLRYSDHLQGDAARVRRQACLMGLEGIICKRTDAPYRGGRTRDWLKVKCLGRDEFVVLGWTPPDRNRKGFGSLHLGFYDDAGQLHYVGGLGAGFDDAALTRIGRALRGLVSTPPDSLMLSGDPPDPHIHWVRPAMVVEVQYTGWTGAGRLRHAVFLGVRADKDAAEVVRDIPDPQAKRHRWTRPARASGTIVQAAAPARGRVSRQMNGVDLTHADRELWPGITKADLVAYWQAVAPWALPELARRPLSLVRCPDGIDGQHFFQKHLGKGMPSALRGGESPEGPYVALDDQAGLVACAQVAAIELHGWGATEADTAHPDRIVFDLDPGEGVAFAEIVRAARNTRDRLKALGLESFCRTTGGKGLHVVAPLRPLAGWEVVKPFCRDLARTMEAEEPARFIASVSKAKRRGRILVDWLRNGPGATAVASFSPRARAGAGVATPLSWREVTNALDPAAFTIHTVPARLKRRRAHPWAGFETLQQTLPDSPAKKGR